MTKQPIRKRRSRLQQPVTLKICSDVVPNDRHPLVEIAPIDRASGRQGVIADILARLARTQIENRAAKVKADRLSRGPIDSSEGN